MKATLLILAVAVVAGCQTKPAVDPRDAQITALTKRLDATDSSLYYVTNAYPMMFTVLLNHTTNSEHRLDVLEQPSRRVDK